MSKLFLVSSIFLTVACLLLQPSPGAMSAPASQPVQASVVRNHQNLIFPLQFEANLGQTDPMVQFISRGPAYALFLTESGAIFSLRSGVQRPDDLRPWFSKTEEPLIVTMHLKGADRPSQIRGEGELPARVNYFRGKDPQRWLRDVPTYSRVRYEAVYPGINIVYYGRDGQLEYDFVVAPGADPNAIAVGFRGTDPPAIDSRGDLVLGIGEDALRLKRPVAFQLGARNFRHPVLVDYVLKEDGSVGFRLGEYDESRILIIDPVIVYSTYIGGTGDDGGHDIAVDAEGNAYITGVTFSPDFPGGGELSGSGFVSKINTEGSAIVFTTFLGGTGLTVGWGIDLDSDGNLYVTGHTQATDFPTTPGAWRTMFECCGNDGFLTKLDTDGDIIYSTYLSGGHTDFGGADDVVVDADGNAYVIGRAKEGFPSTPGAFDISFSGNDDVFVMKMNATGTNAIYSTALGNGAIPGGIDIDAEGNAYVTGTAIGNPFPTTDGAFWDGDGNGFSEIFVAKLNPTGSSLVYSTLIKEVEDGGGGRGADIVVDQSGNAVVTGWANLGFPVTDNSDELFDFAGMIFVTKLNQDGSDLIFSTRLGGGRGAGIALDSAENAYVTGQASGIIEPIVNPFQADRGGGRDAFAAVYDPQGSIIYSSYLGGSFHDNLDDNFVNIGAIAVDLAGNAYITGETSSDDFPVASLQEEFGGGQSDVFLTKVSAEVPTSRLYFSQFANGGVGFTSDLVVFNPSAGSALAGEVLFFDQDGNQVDPDNFLSASENVPVQAEAGFNLPAFGSQTFSTNGQGDLVEGSVVVESEGTAGGVLRFFLPGVGLTGVGSATPGGEVIVPVRKEGLLNSGVAIRNVGSENVTVDLTLKDEAGQTVSEGIAQIELSGNARVAQFLNELFPNADTDGFRGSICVRVQNGTVAVMALELEVSESPKFTTLPVSPIVSAVNQALQVGPHTLYFAQFANGGIGFTADLTIFNPSDNSGVAGEVRFFDQAGNEVEASTFLSSEGENTLQQEGAAFDLPALGSQTFSTNGVGELVEGSVRVDADGPIAGVLRFLLPGVGLTGVGSAKPGQQVIVPVRRQGALNSGVAVRNTTAAAVTVDLSLKDEEGNQVDGGMAQRQLSPNARVAQFLHELFPEADTASFVGTICVTAGEGEVAVMALELEVSEDPKFTTLPVSEIIN